MESEALKQEVNLNQIVLLTIDQAKTRYNIGRNNIKVLADKIGAAVPVGESGGKILYVRKKLDNYFENM